MLSKNENATTYRAAQEFKPKPGRVHKLITIISFIVRHDKRCTLGTIECSSEH